MVTEGEEKYKCEADDVIPDSPDKCYGAGYRTVFVDQEIADFSSHGTEDAWIFNPEEIGNVFHLAAYECDKRDNCKGFTIKRPGAPDSETERDFAILLPTDSDNFGITELSGLTVTDKEGSYVLGKDDSCKGGDDSVIISASSHGDP